MRNKSRFNEVFDRPLLKNMARKIGPGCGAGDENKMAESEVKELEVKERKRKPNFSPLEISVITQSVKKHSDVMQSKLTNNISLGGDYKGGEWCWLSESLHQKKKRQVEEPPLKSQKRIK